MAYRRVVLGTKAYKVLRVPAYYQGESENAPEGYQSDNYCIPVSLKMMLDFLVDYSGDPQVAEMNPSWKVQEIAELLPFDPMGGCTVDPRFLDGINENLHNLELAPKKFESSSNLHTEYLKERPSMVLYNPRALITGARGGMGHASVVVDVTEDEILVNDPFQQSPVSIPRRTFEMAWIQEPLNTVVARTPFQKKLYDDEYKDEEDQQKISDLRPEDRRK